MLPTMCSHNGEGQQLVPGKTTRCRMCGAPLSIPVGTQEGQSATALPPTVAEYPGESNQENEEA